jgi:hypothetical protein
VTDYRFVTTWRIDVPIEPVFEAIYRSDRWPEWWRGVVSVEQVHRGDAEGIGDRRRYAWKSRLPYRLVFDVTTTCIERPTRLEGVASGELEGTGRWRLTETASGTDVRYTWEVRTTRWWMNLLGPVARPFFAWNHDVVMRWGGEGLGRLLGAHVEHIRDATDLDV